MRRCIQLFRVWRGGALVAWRRSCWRRSFHMALVLLAWLVPAGALWAQHTHGVGQLDITQDGAVLQLELSLPLESVVGFERAPRTPAERELASQVLARLRRPGGGFVPSPEAGCRPGALVMEAGPLEATSTTPATAADGHADLQVRYRFECQQPGRLAAVQTDVFDSLPRLQGLRVQLATVRGQARQQLRRPLRSIPLVR